MNGVKKLAEGQEPSVEGLTTEQKRDVEKLTGLECGIFSVQVQPQKSYWHGHSAPFFILNYILRPILRPS